LHGTVVKKVLVTSLTHPVTFLVLITQSIEEIYF